MESFLAGLVVCAVYAGVFVLGMWLGVLAWNAAEAWILGSEDEV